MAQEDTELRDLVIEALEKNGSLAKIRALLRANVFLAFEDESSHLSHNETLDSILKTPDGLLCLSIVHEFLEYCKLKNTIFVYMAETRQGKAYTYEGKNVLSEKLSSLQPREAKQPALIALLKNFKSKELHRRKLYDHGDNDDSVGNIHKCSQYEAEKNCTYDIHHDYSEGSNNSTSQSDNSHDERNKLHLHLPLDNSDTDTSSESARNKSMAAEYVPSKHIIDNHSRSEDDKNNGTCKSNNNSIQKADIHSTVKKIQCSSDSTSYLELKAADTCDSIGIQNFVQEQSHLLSNSQSKISILNNNLCESKSNDSVSSTLSSVATLTSKQNIWATENFVQESANSTVNNPNTKSDVETPEYSYDFTQTTSVRKPDNESSPRYDNSPHSSISISDVADLIDKSDSLMFSPKGKENVFNNSGFENNDKTKNTKSLLSNDSDEFSVSPIPSLTNLSLDLNSD